LGGFPTKHLCEFETPLLFNETSKPGFSIFFLKYWFNILNFSLALIALQQYLAGQEIPAVDDPEY
jgi:hypothetical protein